MGNLINKVKEIIKKNKKLTTFLVIIYKYNRKSKNIFYTFMYALKGMVCFYTPKLDNNRGIQIKKLFNKIKIKISNNHFIYYLDPFKLLFSSKFAIENTTIDYSIALEKPLSQMKLENNQMKSSEYKENQRELLLGIEEIIQKTINELKKSNKKNKEKYIEYFENIKENKAKTFEEALQRILFYNQLLWQTGHPLNGLGRLDLILDKYYLNDIANKIIDKKEAAKLIREFMKTLHENYWFKSNSLLGDTGQIIILGGRNENGKYFYNDLTYMFIEEIKKLQLPDPKVLLRISKDTPRDLMKLAVECIQTGIGCPLFANDDVIIPKLIEFGYNKVDCYNYATSACWEPLIVGKSLEQNNMKSIVFIKPFIEMLNTENLNKIKSFEQLMSTYKKYLEKYINNFFDELDTREFEKDPLMSLFIENCNKKETDIANGGAIYNNYGVTSVSLANTVNSIINIRKFVFKDQKYTLEELNAIRQSNFVDNEELLNKLKKQDNRYGKDSEEVINIANTITSWTNDIFKRRKNKYGGMVKFGLSAPTYIDESKNVEASFDGRKDGDPFIVHISSDITTLPYTELVQFSSNLDYSGNRFNGNVVDFMVTPSFIEDNFEKFMDFLILSIEVGFFEMQMNVISSDILIRAKENPKEFPNLIVRVWGFSAYFNDLPEEYKNVLIERALINEGKNN